jgi:hypothetical protein
MNELLDDVCDSHILRRYTDTLILQHVITAHTDVSGPFNQQIAQRVYSG